MTPAGGVGATPDPLTLAALEAREGDQAALRTLLAGTQGSVRRFCASMVPGEDADDLVQETYLRAWRALGGFRGDSSVTTWLIAIARRVCIESITRSARRRRADNRPSEGARTDEAGGEPGPAGGAGVVELTDLIGRLDPDRREALVLTQLAGLTYAETALVTGCEIGTVRSRVARARRQLLQWMAEEGQA